MPARLHIGDQQLTVRFDDGSNGGVEPVVLAIGLSTLRQRYLRHQPQPMLTDDVESVALLGSMDWAAGTATELDVTHIERQFNRLVDVANGLPAANAGLPMRGDFAANLLILREPMHHAGRTTLTVRAPTNSRVQP